MFINVILTNTRWAGKAEHRFRIKIAENITCSLNSRDIRDIKFQFEKYSGITNKTLKKLIDNLDSKVYPKIFENQYRTQRENEIIRQYRSKYSYRTLYAKIFT